MADKLSILTRAIRNKMKQQYDFVLVIIGPEGSGKSSLAWFLQKEYHHSFGPDDNIFAPDEFRVKIRKAKKFRGKNIDEGAIVFFSGDASTREGRMSIKLLTGMRDYFQFCTICIPNFWILTKYIREHRVKAVLRIVKRGWVFYYGPKKVKKIKRDKRTLKTIWPDWDFRDSFPDASRLWPEEWEQYKDRKRKEILDTPDPSSGPKAICNKCGYLWTFLGKTAPRCPRCGSRSVAVEGVNDIDTKSARGSPEGQKKVLSK